MKNWLLYEENPMVKLCYQNNGRNTEEFYFDLQSQKYIKSVFRHIMQSKTQKGSHGFSSQAESWQHF